MDQRETATVKALTNSAKNILDLVNGYVDAHIDADTLAFDDEPESSEEWEDPQSQIPSTVSVQAD